jgi:hypothetical protein
MFFLLKSVSKKLFSASNRAISFRVTLLQEILNESNLSALLNQASLSFQLKSLPSLLPTALFISPLLSLINTAHSTLQLCLKPQVYSHSLFLLLGQGPRGCVWWVSEGRLPRSDVTPLHHRGLVCSRCDTREYPRRLLPSHAATCTLLRFTIHIVIQAQGFHFLRAWEDEKMITKWVKLQTASRLTQTVIRLWQNSSKVTYFILCKLHLVRADNSSDTAMSLFLTLLNDSKSTAAISYNRKGSYSMIIKDRRERCVFKVSIPEFVCGD